MTPTIGRIVHYVLPVGPNAGQHRPAIIVDVEGSHCHLYVFTKAGDMIPSGLQPAAGFYPLLPGESGFPGTWHWPETVS